MEKTIKFKLVGDTIKIGFSALKDTLPAITRYKHKYIGKWHKKK
jgi:hypothetical protein|tara:strand:+ start:551 stop:682 length:132 start_codon:yes stop_codon:yes gene_type:complete